MVDCEGDSDAAAVGVLAADCDGQFDGVLLAVGKAVRIFAADGVGQLVLLMLLLVEIDGVLDALTEVEVEVEVDDGPTGLIIIKYMTTLRIISKSKHTINNV